MIDRLDAAGLRPTHQRVALATLLFSGDARHITAEQLYTEAKSAGLKVSFATIYNVVNLFTEYGLLREIAIKPGIALYDTNVAEHSHFYFEDTQQLVDIPGTIPFLDFLPPPPSGTIIKRIDLIIRVRAS